MVWIHLRCLAPELHYFGVEFIPEVFEIANQSSGYQLTFDFPKDPDEAIQVLGPLKQDCPGEFFSRPGCPQAKVFPACSD